MLTQQQLKELLHYDPETGIFTWTNSPRRGWNGRKAGAICKQYGYVVISINHSYYRAHRLAWLYVHGAWPENQIDHKNGIRSDNKFSNLREATHTGNQQNQRTPHKNNTSGFLGVAIEKGRYVPYIRINGRKQRLGGYDDGETAHQVYLAKKREVHETCTI